MGQDVALHDADAVLGRDRAAELLHHREHHGVDLVPARQEFGFVRAFGLRHVVVDVAVADMAERQRTAARDEFHHRGIGLLDEGRDRRYRHRHVVLDGSADMPLHFAEHFADAPERFALRAAVGDGGVEHQPLLVPGMENVLHHTAQAALRLRRQFDQHEPWVVAGERHPAR